MFDWSYTRPLNFRNNKKCETLKKKFIQASMTYKQKDIESIDLCLVLPATAWLQDSRYLINIITYLVLPVVRLSK